MTPRTSTVLGLATLAAATLLVVLGHLSAEAWLALLAGGAGGASAVRSTGSQPSASGPAAEGIDDRP